MARTTKKITAVELLDETLLYYALNPRGYDSTSRFCLYETAAGARCALGRILTTKARKVAKSCSGGYETLLSILSDYINRETFLASLQPHYRNPAFLGTGADSFFARLQCFHDTGDNWVENDQGGSFLSNTGELHIAELRSYARHLDETTPA